MGVSFAPQGRKFAFSLISFEMAHTPVRHARLLLDIATSPRRDPPKDVYLEMQRRATGLLKTMIASRVRDKLLCEFPDYKVPCERGT